MILQPSSAEHLSQLLVANASSRKKIERVDLAALNRVMEYTPTDMTITVGAGMTLAALQGELSKHRQELPLDPPHAERLTISELITANPSGPRRFGYGTIRDYLIGIEVALADGTLIHSGGKVVKNVAGYDLLKLFVGSHNSLGIVTRATFKLRPLPEHEDFTEVQCESLEQADKLIEALLKTEITPVVLDLHNLGGVTLVLGFAGRREEVSWQLARAAELGFTKPATLDYAAQFWADDSPAQRLSVLPSKLIAAIRGLQSIPFIARAGNGVIYHRGPASPRPDGLPLVLMQRVKDAYDPHHILPDVPL